MPEAENVSTLESHVGYWLRFVSNHVSHAFKIKVEQHGVTVAEWVILRELFDRRDLLAHELAERIGMTRGAISKLIVHLTRKALLRNAIKSEDRRCQNLELTPAGRSLVRKLAAMADANDAEFFGHLPTERRHELLGMLKEIVARRTLRKVPVE